MWGIRSPFAGPSMCAGPRWVLWGCGTPRGIGRDLISASAECCGGATHKRGYCRWTPAGWLRGTGDTGRVWTTSPTRPGKPFPGRKTQSLQRFPSRPRESRGPPDSVLAHKKARSASVARTRLFQDIAFGRRCPFVRKRFGKSERNGLVSRDNSPVARA